jgi:hypothetical protein
MGGILMEHPPYSPDIATYVFWAFSVLKCALQGKKFSTDMEVIQTTAAAQTLDVGKQPTTHG